MQLGAGTTLREGKYFLNHVLNQQGIGWTYRATHAQSNQSVVVKTLNPVFRSHPEYQRMAEEFEERSQQWAKIQHPGLVRVLDFFYEETLPQTMPFVVMESVVGTNLGDRLRSETLSEADIILLLRQLSSALTQTQDQGLVHGNLRPQNIIRRSGLQDSGSQAYVLVGSAASLMPSLFERSALQNPYAAPELSHGKITSSADLYSLGAILYTCLSGHSPTLTPIDAELNDRLPLLSLLKPGAIRLLRSAMATAPSDRPATADDWLALLASRSAAATSAIALPTIAPIAPIPSPIATPEPFPPYRTEALPQKPVSPTVSPTVSQPAVPIAVPIQLPTFQPSPPPAQIQPIQRAEFSPNPNPTKPSPFTLHPSPFKTLLPPIRSLKRTAGIAAIVGILFGLVLRFHAAQRPGASLFHTGQSFPAREWKGTIDPPQDNSGNIPIEAPGSTSRPNPSRSTELNPAPAPEKSSERPPDNPVPPELPPAVLPSQNRRTAVPSEFLPDSGSDNASRPEQPDRSTLPDFPLQRDPESISAPDPAPAPVGDPIPESVPVPESPTTPRSPSRPNLSPKKGL